MTLPDWHWNEMQQVGTDYNDLPEVEAYDERMATLRDVDEENRRVLETTHLVEKSGKVSLNNQHLGDLGLTDACEVGLERDSKQLHPALESLALPGFVQFVDEVGLHSHREHFEVAGDAGLAAILDRADGDLAALGLPYFPF